MTFERLVIVGQVKGVVEGLMIAVERRAVDRAGVCGIEGVWIAECLFCC
jgi:hypothetical protein